MKKIFGVVLLVVVAVVGFKFYLEYRYKQELDKLIQGASLFADISYQGLTVGFDGSVDLQGLAVVPNGSFDTFSVKSIKASGVDLLFHLNGKSQIKKGEFPKFLTLAVKQASFPASVYEQNYAKQECKNAWGTNLYSAAGYDEVIMDGRMEFDLSDPFAARFNFGGSDQISNSNFSMDFNLREANLASLSSQTMPVQTVTYRYSLEEGAAQDIIQHCADKFKITPEDFVEKVVKSRKFMVNSFQLDLGGAARNAIAEFFQGGKELSINATPSDRLKNVNFASTASPAQIIRMLNLSVSLDGNSVPIQTIRSDLDVDEAEEEFIETASDQPEGFKRRSLDELLNTPDGTVQESSRPNLVKKREDPYERASLNRVSSYIDRDIRISRTNDRSEIEGRLLEVENKVLSIEIFRYGGVMTYTVPYKDISRIDVKKR